MPFDRSAGRQSERTGSAILPDGRACRRRPRVGGSTGSPIGIEGGEGFRFPGYRRLGSGFESLEVQPGRTGAQIVAAQPVGPRPVQHRVGIDQSAARRSWDLMGTLLPWKAGRGRSSEPEHRPERHRHVTRAMARKPATLFLASIHMSSRRGCLPEQHESDRDRRSDFQHLSCTRADRSGNIRRPASSSSIRRPAIRGFRRSAASKGRLVKCKCRLFAPGFYGRGVALIPLISGGSSL